MIMPRTMKQTPLVPLIMASAALHAQAVPAPMEVTAHESATIWTQGYGVGNGRLGALSYGEFPKEILVLNEESIFAKSSIVPREGAAEGLKEAREWCARGDYKKADETFRRKVLSNKSSSGGPEAIGRPLFLPPFRFRAGQDFSIPAKAASRGSFPEE